MSQIKEMRGLEGLRTVSMCGTNKRILIHLFNVIHEA